MLFLQHFLMFPQMLLKKVLLMPSHGVFTKKGSKRTILKKKDTPQAAQRRLVLSERAPLWLQAKVEEANVSGRINQAISNIASKIDRITSLLGMMPYSSLPEACGKLPVNCGQDQLREDLSFVVEA